MPDRIPLIGKLLNWKLIGLLLLVVVLTSIDLTKLLEVLSRTDWKLVGIAIGLQILVIFLQSVRWRLLLRSLGSSYSLWRGFVLYFVSGYMGVVTPLRVGEFWKALRLKKETGVPLSRGILSTIVDRGMDFYTYFFIGLFCAITYGLSREIPVWGWIVLVSLAGLPIPLAWRHGRRKILSVLVPSRLLEQMGIRVQESLDSMEEDLKRILFSRLAVCAVITLCTTFILFFQFWLILEALYVDIPFFTGAMIISLLKFIGNVPVTVFGVGTRDLTLVFIFQTLGLPVYLAVGVSALVLLVNHISVSLAGGVLSLTIPTAVSHTSGNGPYGEVL